MTERSELPDGSVLIRTDFSSDAAWRDLIAASMEPQTSEGFTAVLSPVNDRKWADMSVDEIVDAVGEPPPYYVFVADRRTFSYEERPILAIDLDPDDGTDRTVRVVPSAMWSIENNLSLSNMDFIDFVDNADPDGVFRGI